MRAKLLQACPTLCDHTDCSLPGSSAHGILQARILECTFLETSPSTTPSGDPQERGMQLLLPLKTGGRLVHQLPHPTHRITDPPCLPPPPHPHIPASAQRPEWAEFPRPLHVSLSQSRGALTLSPTGLGRSRQAQPPAAPREPLRWRARSEEEEGRLTGTKAEA